MQRQCTFPNIGCLYCEVDSFKSPLILGCSVWGNGVKKTWSLQKWQLVSQKNPEKSVIQIAGNIIRPKSISYLYSVNISVTSFICNLH